MTDNNKGQKPNLNKQTNSDWENKENQQTKYLPVASKLIGILFIMIAALITILVDKTTKAQYFIIYALIGIGIALLLAKSADNSIARFKTWNISVALAGGVALPFILFFTNPIGSFKSDNQDLPTTTSVTVFVHGKKGRQDMILRQQGHIVMDVGGERKRQDINENGAAYFQNLTIGDSIHLEVDFSEPYKSLYPDSNYVIPRDGKIYLSVVLQGIDKVQGTILFKEHTMEGVTVRIDTLLTTTDKNGYYFINIPESMQRKEYNVWFIKNGFKTKKYTAYPQTEQPLDVVMEKQ